MQNNSAKIHSDMSLQDRKEQKNEQIKSAQDSKKLHENLSEEQIDKTLADSFPASDPPSMP